MVVVQSETAIEGVVVVGPDNCCHSMCYDQRPNYRTQESSKKEEEEEFGLAMIEVSKEIAEEALSNSGEARVKDMI